MSEPWVVPWAEKTAPDRVRPRECIGNARDALNAAYGLTGAAPYPLLIEALEWLRRGLEQMAPPAAEIPGDVKCEARGLCAWPDCDCDCDCFIPTLEGAGQHSPGCRSIKRTEARRES